jgi:cellulose synthase/poly-beta-1,6-N-acetylglucosamine synthase-like glycosyltransferase
LLDYLVALGAIIALSFSFIVHGAYFLRVIRAKKLTSKFQDALLRVQSSNSNLQNVSIIVSTFNEAGVIERKLTNISEFNYPLNKIEVIVMDDASIDGTADLAEKKISELKLDGRVIRNKERIGLNRSLNLAVNEAKYSFVCITDSDVVLQEDALKNSVKTLSGLKDVGGVTGKIKPVFGGGGVAQSNESAYRSFYDQSMLGETALHSSFPGNGPLIVFNKSVVCNKIPVDYGSTDGNIAMNVIKSGFRFVYIPNAIVIEPVPEDLGQQRLQKVRRAQRLIQVFLHNKDVFLNKKYGKFGTTVFPLKFLMVVVAPLFLCVGFGLFIASIVLSHSLVYQLLSVSALVSVTAFGLLWNGFKEMFSSFIFHEIFLVAGLFISLRKSVFWKTIDRKEIQS